MIKSILNKLFFLNFFRDQINKIKINQSINLANSMHTKSLKDINEFNFSIFSQFNEDAIIQFLVKNLNIKIKLL